MKRRTKATAIWTRILFIFILFIVFVIARLSSEEIAKPPAEEIPAGNGRAMPIEQSGEEHDLAVHFIDVGQADSILITMEGSAMLIDAGNNQDSQVVVDYVKTRGITTLDYVIATHPHEDHIGGMDAVINAFEVKNIIMPKVESNTRTFEEVLKAISNKGLKITPPVPGTVYTLGKAEFVIFAPNSERYENTNDYSVVVKLKFGDTSFLFTGDAGFASEDEMIEKGYDLQSDVLKVGHHGSAYSTSKKFLEAVQPQIAVISVGKGNEYGHPAPETIQKLRQANAEIYRTDELGTIVITSDGKTIEVFADKN